MRIVLLTRTSRPSGAFIAKSLIENRKNLVAIIAEERPELLKKKGSLSSALINSLKNYGFRFTRDKVLESLHIRFRFILRKAFTSKIYRSKTYHSAEELVLDHRIPYFTVKNHNSKETEGLISSLSPDLLVVANTRIIHKNILDIPKHGCLNVHASELPKYAGLDSIFWALFHGESKIGVTVHFVNEELDAGDILLQKKIEVSSRDNEKTLRRKAIKLSTEMMLEAVTLIEQGMATSRKQDKSSGSRFGWPTKYHRRLLRKKLKNRSRIKSNRPIKALHIITRLIKGGAQENTLITVLGLRAKGYDVMLASGLTHGPEGEIESVARRSEVNLAIIPELVRSPHPWKDLVSTLKIYSLIRKHRFDVVHTHTSKAGIVGRAAAKLAGVPIIVHTPHGHIFHSYFGPMKTKLFFTLEVIFAGFCDKIITLTDKCKEEHIKLGIANPQKFSTIHSGISLERFRERSYDIKEIKANLNIPITSKVVGTVARLEAVKGISFFINSMKKVTESCPSVHFLVVGDGTQRKILESRARDLGLSGKVIFTGIREDVPELISIMDVFVLSSLNEGMGRVLVEAGLMSKPIVATRVSGIPEIVQDRSTGILVEPGNPQALADGIIDLLSDPQKAEAMGDNARLRMAEHFSAEKMVDKIDALYKEFL